jgi:hypothetical protein
MNFCQKHQHPFTFVCEKCIEGSEAKITRFGKHEAPLLIHAFDKLDQARSWVDETTKIVDNVSIARMRTPLGCFTVVTMHEDGNAFVVCGRRGL